ncbi:MAG TPA: response regulator [Phycisphaerae bacterium]|jgi:CheY-like chemotaxis protein
MHQNNDLQPILLVEDNSHDVELILTALAQSRLANEVVVVRDGVEALDYLHQRGLYRMRGSGHPAVVLLDLKLPKIGGMEVLQQMKADPELQHIPVVMLTSSREPPDLARSYELGAAAYVAKPVDPHDFLDAVTELGLAWAVMQHLQPAGVPQPADSFGLGVRVHES